MLASSQAFAKQYRWKWVKVEGIYFSFYYINQYNKVDMVIIVQFEIRRDLREQKHVGTDEIFLAAFILNLLWIIGQRRKSFQIIAK